MIAAVLLALASPRITVRVSNNARPAVFGRGDRLPPHKPPRRPVGVWVVATWRW